MIVTNQSHMWPRGIGELISAPHPPCAANVSRACPVCSVCARGGNAGSWTTGLRRAQSKIGLKGMFSMLILSALPACQLVTCSQSAAPRHCRFGIGENRGLIARVAQVNTFSSQHFLRRTGRDRLVCEDRPPTVAMHRHARSRDEAARSSVLVRGAWRTNRQGRTPERIPERRILAATKRILAGTMVFFSCV
jgi:hypothetical protein